MSLQHLTLLSCLRLACASKIDRFEVLTKDPLTFLFVHTSDGLTGLGQMGRSQMDSTGTLADADLVNDVFFRHIAPRAHGRNITSPADLRQLRQEILDANYKNMGQMFARALSGLDTALWEIFAKRNEQSVCEFAGDYIGRPCKKNLDFYCTNITRTETPEQLVELVAGLHSRFGAKGYKFKIANTMGHNSDPYPNRSVEVIPKMRQLLDERLGFHAQLMVDANGGYTDLAHASRISALLKESDYYWFEEPVPFYDYQLTKEVKQHGSNVRIAMGENEYREEILKRAMEEGVMDIVQPDFGYAGGFTVLLDIAVLARKLGIEFDPHSPDLSLTEFFSVHLMGAVADDGAMYEFGCTDESTPTDIFVQNLEAANGSTTVPSKPGWGVEVRPAWLEKAQKRVYPPDNGLETAFV